MLKLVVYSLFKDSVTSKFKIDLLLGILLFTLIGVSCKSKDPIVNMFSEFIRSSKEVNIAFGNRLDTSEIIFDTTISHNSEVERIKEFVTQISKKDTCYQVSGSITFVNSSGAGFLIDFNLDPRCPSYYFYTEDRPIGYRMSYQSGMYLSELQNLLLKSRHK